MVATLDYHCNRSLDGADFVGSSGSAYSEDMTANADVQRGAQL